MKSGFWGTVVVFHNANLPQKAHDTDFSTFTNHCASFRENDFAPDEPGHLWDAGS
jgi:hypothetical protein